MSESAKARTADLCRLARGSAPPLFEPAPRLLFAGDESRANGGSAQMPRQPARARPENPCQKVCERGRTPLLAHAMPLVVGTLIRRCRLIRLRQIERPAQLYGRLPCGKSGAGVRSPSPKNYLDPSKIAHRMRVVRGICGHSRHSERSPLWDSPLQGGFHGRQVERLRTWDRPE